MEAVYLDNAATTPMDPQVISVMQKQMTQTFGNASTPNYYGHAARAVLDQARQTIAQSIHAQTGEIVFTSGGSEGDNTAIISTALYYQKNGRHIITSQIEHEAVLKSLHYLEGLGFEVTYLPVDDQGRITVSQVQRALRPDTILVTIMFVNNEVGVINPIAGIGNLLQDHQAIFHTDAVQAYGTQIIDVQALKVDLLTTSAHKLYGPKMLGFIYERQEIQVPPLIHGGDQENKRRAGTENVPAIAGFAQAVKINQALLDQQGAAQLTAKKELLLQELRQNQVEFQVNGPQPQLASPNIINLWFPHQATDILQIKLDLAGFVVSGGSACTAGSLEPSHVLIAMYGADSPRVRESIRVSFNKFNTAAQIKAFAQSIAQITLA
ncbi:cysteine desulfurase [Lactobacillus sp. DCY120]|uniref:Cysteine desulfurase n=1 Tax=Bombilactobacillus apium TaxID=2675299 RepID=A0A850QYF5_9LACO|nr:aminotransferase class V-fold PLP-dependent enzyme [Bombilactobacillus apium]NVY95693.1 cysteine desulfurase [Bombilactobacillus apium]